MEVYGLRVVIIYKDDLQAAYAKAEAAEQKAERAEHRALLVEKELKNVGRTIMLRPFKWMYDRKKGIAITVGIMVFIFSNWRMYKYGINMDTFEKCIKTHCTHECLKIHYSEYKKKNNHLVTSSWTWINREKVFACSCHFKRRKGFVELPCS